MINRAAEVGARIESLERDMELLCVTGVEDKCVRLFSSFQNVQMILKANFINFTKKNLQASTWC